ncbi:hypothetical protein TSAR_002672 [Trichomalopsis sarcophagae]|uniref:Uncharacterized protein n=1 Tax=Trichomalopsis sarcophagae TaxID=543379 RepID=A0A232F133_9HYME|nr:hypothetical protein TSAR_002672 [Trichomalopsis sarcophagae]
MCVDAKIVCVEMTSGISSSKKLDVYQVECLGLIDRYKKSNFAIINSVVYVIADGNKCGVNAVSLVKSLLKGVQQVLPGNIGRIAPEQSLIILNCIPSGPTEFERAVLRAIKIFLGDTLTVGRRWENIFEVNLTANLTKMIQTIPTVLAKSSKHFTSFKKKNLFLNHPRSPT